ncbi:MAG TPA: RNA ligase family protein, partial [Vicinamibacterales bacterium]
MEADFMPMLCGKTDVVDHDSGRWIMEPKIDGWRAICHYDTTLNVRTYARSGAQYDGKCPHIDDALKALLPVDTVLDGEFAGAGGWGDVQGVMTRHANNGTMLTYVVFDLIRLGGIDARSLPWDSRRELLEKIGFAGAVVLNPYGEPDQAVADAMIDAGAEGVVLKRRDSRYSNGRSQSWQKYKPKVGTDEGEIIGFKPGEKGGKFDGMVGAFKVRMLA